jgi:hypothetical protein
MNPISQQKEHPMTEAEKAAVQTTDHPEIPEDLGELKMPPEAFQEVNVPEGVTARVFATHTAAQFFALAVKVKQCGFDDFANTLSAAAIGLRDGLYDKAIASADQEALAAADSLLLEATSACVDVLSGG